MIERDRLEFKVEKTRLVALFHRDYFYENDRAVTITTCILRRKGCTLAMGVATCNPRDHSDFKAGQKLALARAIKDFAKRNLSRVDHQLRLCEQVWQIILATGYFDKPKTDNPAIVMVMDETVNVEVAA